MTSDITIRGMMPTATEYAAHLVLLREIAAAGLTGVSAWRATTLDVVQARAWCALFTCGVVRYREARPWNFVVLTDYGRRYFAERAAAVA
jgi:hypothetical protein